MLSHARIAMFERMCARGARRSKRAKGSRQAGTGKRAARDRRPPWMAQRAGHAAHRTAAATTHPARNARCPGNGPRGARRGPTRHAIDGSARLWLSASDRPPRAARAAGAAARGPGATHRAAQRERVGGERETEHVR